MKLLLLTNMPSYHQIEFAHALVSILGENNFRLGIFNKVSKERLQMKWRDNYQANYILQRSDSSAARDEIDDWIRSADVVIQGRFPMRHLRQRIKAGGLTFAYQERLWKKKFSIFRLIRRLPHLYKNYWSANRRNYHLLAAGTDVSKDLTALGVFIGRCWKFGYFIAAKPPVNKTDIGTKLELVWCGRMIDCKQPIKALEIAHGLKQAGIQFNLNIIGDGALRQKVETAIKQLRLEAHVKLLGWQSHDVVDIYLEQADILLMTSDHREGWGLVINEAINNRCFVVTNQAPGAAKWLLRNDETGIVYQENDLTAAIDCLIQLCLDQEKLQAMAEQAYLDLTENWSTVAAANRIVMLSEALLKQESAKPPFSTGLCSALIRGTSLTPQC